MTPTLLQRLAEERYSTYQPDDYHDPAAEIADLQTLADTYAALHGDTPGITRARREAIT